jgi:hypothetical protein
MLRIDPPEIPPISPKAQEWLFFAHQSMKKARTAATVPHMFFQELADAGLMEGVSTNARLTQLGFQALTYLYGSEMLRKGGMKGRK